MGHVPTAMEPPWYMARTVPRQSGTLWAFLGIVAACWMLAVLFAYFNMDAAGSNAASMFVYGSAGVAVIVWFVVIVLLGGLPGRIAKQRGHPQQDAIRICGWVGWFTLGIFWLIALIWAHTNDIRASR